MFEKKFLAYVLYVTLIEIREEAYEHNRARQYRLADMLHNVPAALLDEEAAKEEYKKLLEAVRSLNVPEWLAAREEEFYNRFPEFKKS